MNVLIWLLTVVHVCVALFLIVLVLMQKSSEQGVGAAFGGGMTDTVFGGGTTTALVRITVWCACILLGTTLILAVLHSHREARHSLMQNAMQSGGAVPLSMPGGSQPPVLPVTPETQPSTAPGSQPSQSPAQGAAPSAPSTPAAPPSQPAK